MNKKEEQYLMRKSQILDIALSHFIKYGYYGTSTRKISDEAGISSGLMFHYFSDKKAIYEELVQLGSEKMTIPEEYGDNPLIFFEKQVEGFLGVASHDDFSSRMFIFMGLAAINAQDISEKAYDMIKEHDVEKYSVPIIKKGQKMGVFRKGDPLALSIVFYGGIQGFATNLVRREGLKLPDKECFLACLKAENV